MIRIKKFSLVCVQNGICLFFWREKFYGLPLLNFCVKKLLGETLCKFFQIFPTKVLVYIGQIFYDTFVINLIEFQ